MKSRHQHVAIGALIILIGLLILLHNIRVLYLSEQLFWGVGLIILGGIFLRVYNRKSPQKSIMFLGILFLIIGLFILLDTLFYFPGDLIGTFFLWIGGTIFISSYAHNNHRWWTLIPGGVLLILGIIVALNAFHLLMGDILWFIFLLGTSLIFWYLFLIKDEINKLNWALYPAFLLTIFAFFTLSFIWESRLSDVLFPISIIFCGVYLLIINIRQKTQISTKSHTQNKKKG